MRINLPPLMTIKIQEEWVLLDWAFHFLDAYDLACGTLTRLGGPLIGHKRNPHIYIFINFNF